MQGCNDIGKTGSMDVHFSRQEKTQGIKKIYVNSQREFMSNTEKILKF